MAKVIAILNEPKSCMYCEFVSRVICGVKHNNMTSNAKFPEIVMYDIYKNKVDGTKPDWYPLKLIPGKLERGVVTEDGYDTSYEEGWNDCIDHITFMGETGYERDYRN